MKSDLSNLKVGDKIWTIQEGWVKVIYNKWCSTYPIRAGRNSFDINGLRSDADQHPSAFLTNPFEGYKVDEAFIKEAYQSACSDWKAKIKDKFPDVFKETTPQLGKWYWANGTAKDKKTYLYCYQGLISYGFDWASQYTNDLHTFGNGLEATEQEVKEALINEAKKEGLKRGLLFNFDGKLIDAKGKLNFNHQGRLNDLYFTDSERFIYRDGTWAEIIQQPIELTLEEIADKFNIDVKLLKIKK